jgi:hypothetical protein
MRKTEQNEKDYKTGDEVGKELSQAGVKTVVLNACESASFRSSSRGSNLAEVLLSHGVQSVLAMAYRVVDEAVEIFMSAFYHCLLIDGLSVHHAARISRLALMKSRSRRARYMCKVQLSDYIVPVVYISNPDDRKGSSAQSLTATTFSEPGLTSMKYVSSLTQPSDAMLPTRLGSFGRDSDILSLKLLLASSGLVLLHGPGGCGKSELLSYVCHWWNASG